MSKKTFFKRIALGVIAAMGLGFMVSPSAQAVRLTNSLTLSSATATANVGDTATVTVTVRSTATQDNTDSSTVRVSCDAPTGFTCPALSGYQDALADTANVTVLGTRVGVWTALSGWGDTQSAASSSMRSTISVKATSFPGAGTYTYTLYLTGNGGVSDVITGTSTTWTVTVSGISTTAAAGSADVYISEDTATAMNARLAFRSATDSAIVATRGTAVDPRFTGWAYLVVKNAAGETRVAQGNGFVPVQDSVTVTVSGPGLVRAGGYGTAAKSATLSVSNSGTSFYGTETLAIYADGTAGTMTLTFSKGVTTLATKTVTFFGTPASVVTNLSDTYTALRTAGTSTVTLSGQVKDSGGNVLSTGQVYIFSSDTKIAGNVPTTAVFGQTSHACNSYLGSSAATYRLDCPIILRDTGVVTLTVGDSWTIANSTWTSTAIELTITGNVVGSATVSFNKATYAPGERAVITITALDRAGKALASGFTGTGSTLARAPQSNYTLTGVTTAGVSGTAGGSDNTYSTTLTTLMDTGVETRVVTMPSFGADISYTISVSNHPLSLGTFTDVTATAKVVDPNATAIAAAQAAANAAGAAATAAADAATDAALEAIDAANAATDAANLAAEAADAATVAAEEARDAADAATAAVEALATEVATLMAALKAQITTLARTVAKIAKKVNA